MNLNEAIQQIRGNATAAIRLYYEKVDCEGAQALAKALESNKTVAKLFLHHNHMDDESAKILAKMLESNKTLTVLELSSNEISNGGAKTLAKMLESNQSLTELHLGENQIGDEGAKALAKMLESNQTLMSLTLQFNSIGIEGAKALAKMLEINKTLISLNVGSNRFSYKEENIIGRLIEINRKMATDLLTAAKHGDFATVKQAVEAGVAINYQGEGEGKDTALHLAARAGHQAIADYLLSLPQQLLLKNTKGQYPFGLSHEVLLQRRQQIIDSQSSFQDKQSSTIQEGLDNADVWLAQDKPEQAVGWYDYILTLNPNCLPALQGKAAILQKQGQLSQAAGCYKAILAISPTDKDAKQQLAYCQQAASSAGSKDACDYYQALYDYSAQDKDELSFAKGELLKVIDKVDDNWWLCQLHHTQGLAPSNYLQALSSESTTTQQLDKVNVLQAKLQTEQTLLAKGLMGHLSAKLEQPTLNSTTQNDSQEQALIGLLANVRQYTSVLNSVPDINWQQHTEELQALKQQHETLALQLSQLKQSSDTQDELTQARIKELETHQQVLWADYETRQAILEQQQYIQKQPELMAFYNRVQLKLTELFLACKVIDSKMVERQPDKTNERLTKGAWVAGKVGQVANSSVISFAGSLIDIALPGAGTAISIGSKVVSLGAQAVGKGLELGNQAHDKREGVKLAKVSSLAVSITAMDKLTEEVARLLTLRYQDQIKVLSTEKLITGLKGLAAKVDMANSKQNGGAEDFAECAVGRILEAMRQGSVDPAQAKPLVEQLLESVFASKQKQGIPLLKHKSLETKDPQRYRDWTDHGIFQQSGIKTAEGSFYKGTEKQDYCNQPERYGYRSGSEEEAKVLGLIPSTAQQVWNINPVSAKAPQPSKVFTQHVQQVTQGQTAISQAHEVHQKQLLAEQQRRIELEQKLKEQEQKQQQEMEIMRQQMQQMQAMMQQMMQNHPPTQPSNTTAASGATPGFFQPQPATKLRSSSVRSESINPGAASDRSARSP